MVESLTAANLPKLTRTKELGTEVFHLISTLTPIVVVDLLIENERGEILLSFRDDELYGRGWHMPGGVLRHGEPIIERLKRVAATELGAQLHDEHDLLELYEARDDVRDVRGHTICLVYRCTLADGPSPASRFRIPSRKVPQRDQWDWFGAMPSNMLAAHKVYAKYFPLALAL